MEFNDPKKKSNDTSHRHSSESDFAMKLYVEKQGLECKRKELVSLKSWYETYQDLPGSKDLLEKIQQTQEILNSDKWFLSQDQASKVMVEYQNLMDDVQKKDQIIRLQLGERLQPMFAESHAGTLGPFVEQLFNSWGKICTDFGCVHKCMGNVLEKIKKRISIDDLASQSIQELNQSNPAWLQTCAEDIGDLRKYLASYEEQYKIYVDLCKRNSENLRAFVDHPNYSAGKGEAIYMEFNHKKCVFNDQIVFLSKNIQDTINDLNNENKDEVLFDIYHLIMEINANREIYNALFSCESNIKAFLDRQQEYLGKIIHSEPVAQVLDAQDSRLHPGQPLIRRSDKENTSSSISSTTTACQSVISDATLHDHTESLDHKLEKEYVALTSLKSWYNTYQRIFGETSYGLIPQEPFDQIMEKFRDLEEAFYALC